MEEVRVRNRPKIFLIWQMSNSTSSFDVKPNKGGSPARLIKFMIDSLIEIIVRLLFELNCEDIIFFEFIAKVVIERVRTI